MSLGNIAVILDIPLPDDSTLIADVSVVAVPKAAEIFFDDGQLRYTVSAKQLGGIAQLNAVQQTFLFKDESSIDVLFSIFGATPSTRKVRVTVSQSALLAHGYVWKATARVTTKTLPVVIS